MITELRLQNFKCLENDRFALSRINVFAGRNGIGKSSVMQSMLLIAQSLGADGSLKTVRLNGKFLQLGYFADVLNRYGKDKNIHIRLVSDDIPDGDYVELVLAEDGKEAGNAILADIKTAQMESSLDTPSANNGAGNEIKSRSAIASVDVTTAYAPLIQMQYTYFVSADRLGPVNTQKWDPSVLLNNVGIHGENVINVLHKGGEALKQAVQHHLSAIMKHSFLDVRENNGDLNLLLDSIDQSEGFKPVNVGFGYSYILTILLTMLAAEPKSKIFIENPEAHLHPGAQSRLVDFLFKLCAEKNLQLFIETHSENIFNAVRRASLSGYGIEPQDVKTYFFYDSQENSRKLHYQEITMADDGSLNAFPEDFFDQTRQELREMMLLAKDRANQ